MGVASTPPPWQKRRELHGEGRCGVADDGQAREQRPLDRARAQEVQAGGERRDVARRQRPAPAAEAQALEEHAPEDRLLERHLREPPVTDRSQVPQPRREAAEEPPAGDVERDLQRVEQVHTRGRAPADQRVVLARHPGPFRERLLRPLERVEIIFNSPFFTGASK